MARKFVRHRISQYVGWLDGTTRIKHLFENPSSLEEFRVVLPDGLIRIASPANLLAISENEFREEALQRAEQKRIEAVRRATALKSQREAQRRAAIQQLCIEHSISSLIHFTRHESLASILSKGLLPRNELERWAPPPPFNDDVRLDGHRDAVCLSISFPNYLMFMKCRSIDPTVAWVVLEIRPEVLWDLDCAFCEHNAASYEIRSVVKSSLRESQALQDMFAQEVAVKGSVHRRGEIPPCFPTDPQAEVLVFGRIQPSHITTVHFSNNANLSRWLQQAPPTPDCKVLTIPAFFSYRQDWAEWKKERSADEGAQ